MRQSGRRAGRTSRPKPRPGVLGLADPARVKILNRLATSPDPVCVCELTGPLGLSQPTVSHHLKKLLEAGLLEREQRGTWADYSRRPDALGGLAAARARQGAPVTTQRPTPTPWASRSGPAMPPPPKLPPVPGIGGVGSRPTAAATAAVAATAGEPGFGAEQYAALDRDQLLPPPCWPAWLRQPDRGGRAARGRDRARPGRRRRLDVLLSAKRVGPAGKALGLDMTEELLAVARRTPPRPARPPSSSHGPDRGPPSRRPRSSGHLQLRGHLSVDTAAVLAETFAAVLETMGERPPAEVIPAVAQAMAAAMDGHIGLLLQLLLEVSRSDPDSHAGPDSQQGAAQAMRTCRWSPVIRTSRWRPAACAGWTRSWRCRP